MGELQDKIQSTTYSIPIYHVKLNVVWKFPFVWWSNKFFNCRRIFFVTRIRGLFRILILRVLSVNKIFAIRVSTDTRLTVTKCQKIPGAPVLKVSNFSIFNIVA